MRDRQSTSQISVRPPRRAPDQPLPPPLRDLDRHKRIVVGPLHAREGGTRERDRQQRGRTRAAGTRRHERVRLVEMAAGVEPQFGERGAQSRRRLPAQHLRRARPVTLQHIERHIELAARRMDRKRLEQARHRMGETGVVRERIDLRLASGAENSPREREEIG